jgi:hypothetical protein
VRTLVIRTLPVNQKLIKKPGHLMIDFSGLFGGQ